MITYLILQRIISHLKATMNVGINSSAHDYVRDIKFGRIQTEPTVNYVYLTVEGGDPTDPNQRDAILVNRGQDLVGFEMPAREVGDAEYWWRRGRVDLGCYFISQGLVEEAAAQKAYSVLERLHKNLMSVNVRGLRTSTEQALKIFVFASTMFESGGPPSQYIWKGSVLWQVLTERSSQE